MCLNSSGSVSQRRRICLFAKRLASSCNERPPFPGRVLAGIARFMASLGKGAPMKSVVLPTSCNRTTTCGNCGECPLIMSLTMTICSPGGCNRATKTLLLVFGSTSYRTRCSLPNLVSRILKSSGPPLPPDLIGDKRGAGRKYPGQGGMGGKSRPCQSCIMSFVCFTTESCGTPKDREFTSAPRLPATQRVCP